MANKAKTNRKNIVLDYDSGFLRNIRNLSSRVDSQISNQTSGQPFIPTPLNEVYAKLSKEDWEEMGAYCI